MQNSGLTGSRIRERRLGQGLRQAALAKAVGISPAYLNLIEHNRRRIGGKLLIDLSRELDVDPSALSEGAETALLEALGDASSGFPQITTEAARVQEMAGRFPGWAALIAAQHRKSQSMERVIEALNDRLTHDPQLADSLHEVLSVVTAIHSTSAILADGEDIDPEWQARFHRNLNEDSQRLAESAQALVAYLAATDEEETTTGSTLPQEELETWLEARDYNIAALEGEYPVPVLQMLALEPQLTSSATASTFAATYLERYRQDALAVPQHRLEFALKDPNFDPLEIAAEFECDLATVLRRIACQRLSEGRPPVGLVICDSSGTLTFRKPVEGFALPQFGASCPLWPLYQALSQPMSPIQRLVEQTGHQSRRFRTYAIAQPTSLSDFNTPQLFEATMLIVPDDRTEVSPGEKPLPVGSSCRICPRELCSARREPSILTNGF